MYAIVGAPGATVLAGVEMETEPAGLEPPASTLTTLTLYVVSGCSCPSVTVVTVLLTVEVNVGPENPAAGATVAIDDVMALRRTQRSHLPPT
jgi:hypothetical protein